MAEALKEIYSKTFFESFLGSLEKVIPNLNQKVFLKKLYHTDWNSLELKQRIKRISDTLETVFPQSFEEAAEILIQFIKQLQKDGITEGGYAYLFLPEFIQQNGLRNTKKSLACIEITTQFVSCEFAIRPFIEQDTESVMKQLIRWSKHYNEHLRRLASEGCRPRLPWASALVDLKKDPSPILPILENLKADPSLYVRKSVANNLNDISKDHPDLFLKLAKRWIGKNSYTNWIVKHASRTLLKDGNSKAMELFGYANINQIKPSNFLLKTGKIKMGQSIDFEFQVQNKSTKAETIRMEYGIYFKKSNQQNNRKVFKISERKLSPKEVIKLSKSHTIKPISTRKYYSGEHFISLIINGHEVEKHTFSLTI